MPPETETLLTLTADNFDTEVTGSRLPVLVDFWAEWCGPCRMIGPTVAELADEFHGRAKVAKLNVDDHPEVAGRFAVRGIPTLLYFKDGQAVDQVVGAAPRDVLAGKLGALVDGD